MKKVLLVAVAVLAVLIGGFCTYVATRPAEYEVSRSRTIAAEPAVLMPLLTDLELWVTWNPWDELDPNATKIFSDPPRGVGAHYTWKGSEEMGEGKMTIVDIGEHTVTYRLDFTAPFESTAEVRMRLEPAAQGSESSAPATEVTWTMSGQNDFMGKLVGVFMDFDGMIGKDFDKGLAKLDAVAAKQG